MILAAIKTGHPLLLASPGNAIVNTTSLLKAANCDVVFYSGPGSPLEVHVKALQNTNPGKRTYEVPSLEQMIAVKSGPYPYNKTYEQAKQDTVLFLHTSGSTGDSKPIRINNAFLARVDADVLVPVPREESWPL
jgi:acyl-coenzyme A synthetase/AMP-(fatty) acid ligase